MPPPFKVLDCPWPGVESERGRRSLGGFHPEGVKEYRVGFVNSISLQMGQIGTDDRIRAPYGRERC
jgi:hypothetical protein